MHGVLNHYDLPDLLAVVNSARAASWRVLHRGHMRLTVGAVILPVDMAVVPRSPSLSHPKRVLLPKAIPRKRAAPTLIVEPRGATRASL